MLTELGYEKSKNDNLCLLKEVIDLCVLPVYVNDIILTSDDKQNLSKSKQIKNQCPIQGSSWT